MRTLRIEKDEQGAATLRDLGEADVRPVDAEEVGQMTASDSPVPVSGLGVGVLGQAAGAGATWYFMTLAPGGTLGRHHTPGEAVCFQVRGSATLDLDDGTSTRLAPGDALLVGDDVPHAFRNAGAEESITAVARLGVPEG